MRYRLKSITSFLITLILCMTLVVQFIPNIVYAEKQKVLLIGDSRLVGMSSSLSDYYILAQVSGTSSGDLSSDGKTWKWLSSYSGSSNRVNTLTSDGITKDVDIVKACKDNKITTIVYMMGRNEVTADNYIGAVSSADKYIKALKSATGCNVIFAYTIPDGKKQSGYEANNKAIKSYNEGVKGKGYTCIDIYTPCIDSKEYNEGNLHYSSYPSAVSALKSGISSSDSKDGGSKISALDFGKQVVDGPMSDCKGWSDDKIEALGESVGLVIQTFRTSGATDEAIAGICANMQHESQFDPFAYEGCYCSGQKDYFTMYLDYKNNGTKSASVDNRISGTYGGLGLIQFTWSGRHDELNKYCSSNGGDFELTFYDQNSSNRGSWFQSKITLATAGTQVAFILQEGGGKGAWNHNESKLKSGALPKLDNGLQDFIKLTDEKKATLYWGACIEVMAGYNTGAPEKRAEDAPAWLTLVKSYTGSELNDDDARDAAQQLYMSGVWDESQFSSFCKLAEIDLTDILNDASINNLNNNELESLNNWKSQTTEEKWYITWGRRIVMLVGIIFVVWAILFYCAFWFDRINTFIDLDVVGILSLRKLKVSVDDTECTFRLTDLAKTDKRTINHKYCLLISVSAVAFGVLLISGIMFAMIRKLVNIVVGFFS